MKIRKILLMLVLLLLLVGCGNHLEDTNGADNFSLETITEEQIINGCPTSALSQSMVRKNNEYQYKVKKITGVEEIFKGSFKNEDVAITINTKVEEGNARIVIVYNDIIIKSLLLNAENQVFSMTKCNGEIRVIIAGESAKMEVSFTVESEKSIS